MTATISGRGAVLSVGRIYCDMVFTGLDTMPRLGREIFAGNMQMALGGGAYIAAAHLAGLGRPVALVARFGTDALSTALSGQLQSRGLNLDFLERHPDAGPQVTVVMASDTERAFLSRRAGRAEPATLAAALAWPQASHLHIAEFASLAEIPDLVGRAKAAGLTVSLDPSWDDTLIRDKGLLAACAGVDVFLPNFEEAQAITRLANPDQALDALANHFPVVALKRGGEGASLAVSGGRYRGFAPKVEVIDTTGAGDAFNAGFLNAWLDGRAPKACLDAGITTGSRSVQAAGGATILHQPSIAS